MQEKALCSNNATELSHAITFFGEKFKTNGQNEFHGKKCELVTAEQHASEVEWINRLIDCSLLEIIIYEQLLHVRYVRHEHVEIKGEHADVQNRTNLKV